MFFNYDSMPFVVTTILVGGLFTYYFYNIFTTTASLQGNESLFNIIPNLDSVNLAESAYLHNIILFFNKKKFLIRRIIY
jgi:hypothetical protein